MMTRQPEVVRVLRATAQHNGQKRGAQSCAELTDRVTEVLRALVEGAGEEAETHFWVFKVQTLPGQDLAALRHLFTALD